MKLGLLIFVVYLYFIAKGIRQPFYCILAYLWLSFLVPQAFVWHQFAQLPFPAAALGIGILLYPFMDTRPFPRVTPVFALSILMVIWITFTTSRAVLPDVAWLKWSWAWKSILLAPVMACFLRTRKQIEAGIIVLFTALLAHMLAAGLKTALGQVHYGSLATLIRSNSWLGESSTLAMTIIMMFPLAYYILHRSLASGSIPFRRILTIVFSALGVLATVGTFARTAIIAGASIIVFGIRSLRTRLIIVAVGIILALAISPFVPASYLSRMSSIHSFDEDASAEGRLDVWMWTLNYVSNHPLGGGFEVYMINQLRGEDAGRAFHSIYFETLGEHGVVGFTIYLSMYMGTLVGLFRLSRRKFPPESEWIRSIAATLFASLVAFLTGGAFVGIAAQPLGYVLVGFYLCLLQAVRAMPALGQWPVMANQPAIAPMGRVPSLPRAGQPVARNSGF